MESNIEFFWTGWLTNICVDVVVIITDAKIPQDGSLVEITDCDHVFNPIRSQILSALDRTEIVEGKSFRDIVDDCLHGDDLNKRAKCVCHAVNFNRSIKKGFTWAARWNSTTSPGRTYPTPGSNHTRSPGRKSRVNIIVGKLVADYLLATFGYLIHLQKMT